MRPRALCLVLCTAGLGMVTAPPSADARSDGGVGRRADVTGSITIGGPPVPVTISNANDNGRITFEGTANQRVSLNVTGVSIWFSYVSIQKPDGSDLVYPQAIFSSGKFIDPVTLPSTGIYTIVVDPYSTATGSMTLTLAEVPPDITGPVTLGDAQTVTIAAAGQNARLSFSGTPGQRVFVKVTGVNLGGGYEVVDLLDPNNVRIGGTGAISSNGNIDTKVLAGSGTYTVKVDPGDAATGPMTLTVYDVPPDVTASMTVNETPVTVTTTVPGQDARIDFVGSAGDTVYLARSGVTLANSVVQILDANGNLVSSSGIVGTYEGSHDTVLPASGSYTIRMDGFGAETGAMNLTLSDEDDQPGGMAADQTDSSDDETQPFVATPTPSSPTGPVAPGSYSTTTWNPDETGASNDVAVVSSTAAGTAAVTGVVLNAWAQGQPVSGATVTLTDSLARSAATTTDAAGTFAFVNMPAETYTLSISAPGLGLYQIINDQYESDTTSQVTAELNLDPKVFDASGTVGETTLTATSAARAYPSFRRIPPSIRVSRVFKNSACARTGVPNPPRVETYQWKYYILRVAKPEIEVVHYNAIGFRAFAAAVSNYAWYFRINSGQASGGADVDDSTSFQCFNTEGRVDGRWKSWVDEVLEHRVIQTGNSRSILLTQYKAGDNPTFCSNPRAGVPSNQLSQWGTKALSEDCGYANWKSIVQFYYTNGRVVRGSPPPHPKASFTRPANGVRFTFRSRVGTAPMAWKYVIVRRRVGTNAWKRIYDRAWDGAARNVPEAFTYEPADGGCAFYKVKATNPAGSSPYSYFSLDSICPG